MLKKFLGTSESKPVAYSVREIVRKRVLQDDKDPWHLALVQRSLKWNEERMARLLDSIIRGYPIGTLLLCELEENSLGMKFRDQSDGAGKVTKVKKHEPQLVDGQQRIHALACIFSDTGTSKTGFEDFGEFFINLEKVSPNKLIDSRKKKRHLWDYIQWSFDGKRPAAKDKSDSDGNLEAGWLRLGGFLEWDNAYGKTINVSKIQNADKKLLIRWLTQIDHKFQPSGAFDSTAQNMARNLLIAWFAKSIPVAMVTLSDTTDLLEVYLRSNLEGVQVSLEDAFFAGVKVIWPETEKYLSNIVNTFPLLTRMHALRVLARLGRLRNTQGEYDLLPFSLEPLNKDEGSEKLIQEMIKISDQHSDSLNKWNQLWKALETRLGFALHFVHPHSIDHVLAWAAQHKAPLQLSSNISKICAYLIGTTAFRFFAVLDEPYSREAMSIAFREGNANHDFPLDVIVTTCCNKWRRDDGLPGKSRQSIRPAKDKNEIFARFRDAEKLLISIAQSVPFNLQGTELEWEHIYPQAKADLMRVREGKMLHQHKDRWTVWHGGNLMALDARLNVELLDRLPTDKREYLNKLDPNKHNPAIQNWSRKLFLSEDEARDLMKASEILSKVPKSNDASQADTNPWAQWDNEVNKAMKFFAKYVRSRSNRIWNDVHSMFPELSAFKVIWETGKEKSEAQAV